MRILLGAIAATAALMSAGTAFGGRGPVTIVSSDICAYNQNGICAEFGANSPPIALQSVQVHAPRSGRVLVSVTGSGVCYNTGSDVEVADFTTELSPNEAFKPNYQDSGANRFEFTLPAQAGNGLTGNGVFNLASQVVYQLPEKSTYTLYLNAAPNRLDSHVKCDVVTISMNALFVPG